MSLTGGIAVNYQTINSHTTKEIAGAIKDMEKKIDEIPVVSLEEVCADIKLARDNIIDKIEYEVNDAKEATK